MIQLVPNFMGAAADWLKVTQYTALFQRHALRHWEWLDKHARQPATPQLHYKWVSTRVDVEEFERLAHSVYSVSAV